MKQWDANTLKWLENTEDTLKNSARKTRIANTMPTIKRGGYRA